jgi:protocatechuate 3,4-dioxygenase, alpha subunit
LSRGQTPSQTVGPFFAYGLTAPQYGYAFNGIAPEGLAEDDAPGERIRIVGSVFDGAGATIADAMIEIWQADHQGRYAHPADQRGSNQGFRGFGRCGTGTDANQRFHFRTVKPGSVDGVQAPHVNIIVFMRGLLTHAYTRLYFPDEPAANAADPVLGSVPEARRHTLIASRDEAADGVVYSLDIHMQGDRETVFFDL